jgi:hypothetical protein
MKTKPSLETIVKEYAKLGLAHRHNRCSECGRRLKLTPGAILFGVGGPERFRTCRSCGYENPTLMEKVAQSLESQGYEVESSEQIAPLPECLNCGKELQISRDFTKVFCCKCGGAWDRYAIEEIFGYPLSPSLAGQIPIPPDNGKEAKELELLISKSEIDSGTAYRVLRVFSSTESQESRNSLSAFAEEVKYGIVAQWTAPIKFVKKFTRKENTEDKAQETDVQYLAIYEDYIAHYVWNGEKLAVSEALYSDIFSDANASLNIPFAIATETRKSYQDFMEFWAQFWVIYRSNLEPFKEVLFGEKARAENEKLIRDASRGGSGPINLTAEIEKLAELHLKGLLTDDEFKSAKSRLLS